MKTFLTPLQTKSMYTSGYHRMTEWECDGVEFYAKEKENGMVVQAFIGKQSKPCWRYLYPKTESGSVNLNKRIESTKKSILARALSKIESKKERKNEIENIKAGDILYTSWGYEQTNIDFYKVLDKKGRTIVLQELQKQMTEANSSMSGYVIPRETFTDREPFTTRTLKLSSYSWLSPWDGKRQYCSWYA